MSDAINTQLLVATFANDDAAQAGMGRLVADGNSHRGGLKELAFVKHDADGALHITENNDMGAGMAAAGGATTGALVGLLGGPIGALLGAAVGGAIGGVAGKYVDSGIPDPQLKDIADALPRGTSAIVALVESGATGPISDALTAVGGKLSSYDVYDQAAERAADHPETAAELIADDPALTEGQIKPPALNH